jgi:hypothetical protein
LHAAQASGLGDRRAGCLRSHAARSRWRPQLTPHAGAGGSRGVPSAGRGSGSDSAGLGAVHSAGSGATQAPEPGFRHPAMRRWPAHSRLQPHTGRAWLSREPKLRCYCATAQCE